MYRFNVDTNYKLHKNDEQKVFNSKKILTFDNNYHNKFKLSDHK